MLQISLSIQHIYNINNMGKVHDPQIGNYSSLLLISILNKEERSQSRNITLTTSYVYSADQ